MSRHFKINFLLLLCLTAALFAEEGKAVEAFTRGDALYRHGRGTPAEFPQALAHFLQAAEAGHPSAQFYAGRMYQLGHGTGRDTVEAAKWYRVAGENGQARAWNNLGNIYADGSTRPHDPQQAIQCYGKASDMGMAMGTDNLAKIYHHGKFDIARDHGRALRLYLLCLKQYPKYPGAWNNIGRLLEGGEHGVERNLQQAKQAYEKGAASNDPDALYNLADLFYDGAFEAKPEHILDLLERAADAGHAEAQFRLGWIHESGRYGTRATHHAIGYYEQAARQGHATALNNLAILLVDSRREAENSPRVIQLLEAAAEKNNKHALNNLGYRHVYQKFPQAKPREGIELLIRSAELGYREAMRNLALVAHHETLAKYFTEAELERWAHAEIDQKKISQQAADDALDDADSLIKRKDYTAALALIDEHYTELRGHKKKDPYSFLARVWWDAQTQRGREDPEWSWRLFDWCRRQYDRDLYHLADNRLAVRRNQISGLIEVGRLGLVRETCEGIRTLLSEIYGLSFDQDQNIAAIDPDGSLPDGIQFDLRVSPEMAQRATWNAAIGHMLSNSAAHCLVALGDERLYAGDWRSAFYFSHWVEHWANSVLASGEIPKNNPRGWVEETLHDSLLLRARTHELLGDWPAAIAVYEHIVHDGRTPYKGRLTHTATLEAAILRARNGTADSLSIPALEKLEAEQRANQFDFGQAGEENQLTRAWILHARDEHTSANELLLSVLQFTERHERPFLRIDALIASVEFGIDQGDLNNRETQLTEALELARSKGLKNIEPRLYELYARFLAADQRLDEAIALQTKAMALIETLELTPRLPMAARALARYFESSKRPNEALALVKHLPTAETHDATWMRQLNELIAQSSGDAPARIDDRLDLQPERITFAPLKNQGGEAIFTLSNPGSRQTQSVLNIESAHIRSVETQVARTRIDLSLLPEDVRTSHRTTIHLAAQEQALIRVQIPPDFSNGLERRLRLSASAGGASATVADLVILPESAGQGVHIVNAAEITDNPFHLIPVFHQISNPHGQTARVSIRTIASRPTRIEAYNEAGQLCFVDAQGNGRFDDPGDLLMTELIDARFPVFTMEEDFGHIELRYQPIERGDAERIEVEIQTRLDSQADWATDAVDWILFTSDRRI